MAQTLARHLIAFAALLLVDAPWPAAAGPTASDIVAAQIESTRAANRQLDAAMRRMKAAHREPRRTTKAKPAVAPAPAFPAPHTSDTETVAATAGKQLQVGPITITPGGFVELQTRSR